ncbi:unnamed protein product [Ectocarpus sp. 4 AP-2014]
MLPPDSAAWPPPAERPHSRGPPDNSGAEAKSAPLPPARADAADSQDLGQIPSLGGSASPTTGVTAGAPQAAGPAVSNGRAKTKTAHIVPNDDDAVFVSDSSGGGSSSSFPPPSKKARINESNPKLLQGSPPKTRVKDAVFVSDSSGGGAPSSSSPPGKKARIACSHPKLLPRSTPKTQAKAAEAVVLAAAVLRGGTLDQ